MKDFVIMSESACSLKKHYRDEYNIEYVHMRMSCDGKDYAADLDWSDISEHEFYETMRAGKRFMTAQVTAVVYKEAFEKIVAQGKDILLISCASALTASIKAAGVAREEVLAQYPDAVITIIDSCAAGKNLGILCIVASKLRAQGKTIDEVADWVRANVNHVHQEGTVITLEYLKRAGRVKAAAAFFAGMLNIKPILISDTDGNNLSVEKVKGRKQSLVRIAERIAERYEPTRELTEIFIQHAECLEDAEFMKKEVEARIPGAVVVIDEIGPIMGASCGPGVIAAFYMGKAIENN